MMNNNKYFEFNKKAFPAYLEMIDNKTEYLLRKQLFNTIPLKMLEFTSKLPIVGGTQLQN
jgi:hypothetical protein